MNNNELLQQAAKGYASNQAKHILPENDYKAFIAGAKWKESQQEIDIEKMLVWVIDNYERDNLGKKVAWIPKNNITKSYKDVDLNVYLTKELINIYKGTTRYIGQGSTIPSTPVPAVVEEEKAPTQDVFNKIGDIRTYLLMHPDPDMIKSSCLHYLGDSYQNFNPNKPAVVKGAEENDNEDLLSWVAILYGSLKELVELNELKKTLYKGNPSGKEYAERKPLAWYAAKQAIELWKKSDYGVLPFKSLSAPEQGGGK